MSGKDVILVASLLLVALDGGLVVLYWFIMYPRGTADEARTGS